MDTAARQIKRNIQAMIDRFLCWKLPKDFNPDGGISFKPPQHEISWPVGTNLFTATQAEQMFIECFAPDYDALAEQVRGLQVELDRRNHVYQNKHAYEWHDLYVAGQARVRWLEEGREMLIYEINRGHSGKCAGDHDCLCPVCNWLTREPVREGEEKHGHGKD